MAYWQVYHVDSTSYLNGVYEVSINEGRQQRIDPYPAGDCTLRFRGSLSWSATPKLNDYVLVEYVDNTYTGSFKSSQAFAGYIRNVSYEYAIVSQADEVVIELDSILAWLGKAQLASFVTTAKESMSQAQDVITEVGFASTRFGGLGASNVIGQTYSGNAFDLVNDLIITEMGFLFEYWVRGSYPAIGYPTIGLYARNYKAFPEDLVYYSGGTTPAILSDTASTNSTHLYYDQIRFKSRAENFYTKAVIDPQTLATQQATKGSAPFNALELSTLDATTAQADDLAEYLVNMYSSKTAFPTEVTFAFGRQEGVAAKQGRFFELLLLGNLVGKRFQVIFRGSTYNVVAEGASIQGSLDDTKITVFFSSEAQNNFLILDDTVYGTLDTNRLGF